VIGCGAVSQSAIPLIPKYIAVPYSALTVVDMVDNSALIKEAIDAGAKFFVDEINVENHEEKLAHYAKPGDFVVDLAYEIPTAVPSIPSRFLRMPSLSHRLLLALIDAHQVVH